MLRGPCPRTWTSRATMRTRNLVITHSGADPRIAYVIVGGPVAGARTGADGMTVGWRGWLDAWADAALAVTPSCVGRRPCRWTAARRVEQLAHVLDVVH